MEALDHLRARCAETEDEPAVAKIARADAADRAARAALQVHGAIGYTQKFGLGRWLTRARALVPAWGTPAQHRAGWRRHGHAARRAHAAAQLFGPPRAHVARLAATLL